MAETLQSDTRDRVLRAAAGLLTAGGRAALSTRAVGAAAGVQAPTLYRLFGDKEGLLAAVAEHGFEQYLAGKAALGETEDPVEDLRRGWDLHVEFGLTHPAFYTLMYGDARPGRDVPAAREAARLLHRVVSRVAAAGRLSVGVPHAARLVHAACVGVTLSLIATAPEERDPGLSRAARDAVLGAIVTASPSVTVPGDPVASRAAALHAALTVHHRQATPLSDPEQALLLEWLNRLSG